MCKKMSIIIKLITLFGLIGQLTMAKRIAANATDNTYYTGILSDLLHTNRENRLPITPLCNQELVAIQSALDMRDIWAIKCK